MHPSKILDFLVNVIKTIIGVWTILRVFIIMALVAYTLLSNIHISLDAHCGETKNETDIIIDNVVCRYCNSR